MTSLAPLVERLDRLARELRGAALPACGSRDGLVIAGHLVARAWQTRRSSRALRRILVDFALVAATVKLFGRGAMHARGGAFFPLAFLPDYHGPHFHDALRRLITPGTGPFVVHLGVTGRCPWQCRYCFASAGGPAAADPDDAAVERVAESLAERHVPIVILGGGEPLTRFDRAARLAGILARGCEVRLTTSGAGLTRDRAAALRDAGVRAVAVSLDSADRERGDALRGPGAVETAERALVTLAASGLFTLVTSVVGRGSFPTEREVDRFLRRVSSLAPAALVAFLPEFATGRGSAAGFRSPDEFAVVGRRLTRAIRGGRHRAGVFYGSPMDALVGCVGAAQRQLHVDARGNLLCCVSRASFGNLFAEPFDDVWRRMLAAPARFQRGYFCAHAALASPAGAVLDPPATHEALEAFFAVTPDAALQRLIEAAGPLLSRLVADESASSEG